MAYAWDGTFYTGTAGQTVTFSLRDVAGTAAATQPTFAYVDHGAGHYSVHTANMNSGQRGVVRALVGGTVVALILVTPVETENTDIKSSAIEAGLADAVGDGNVAVDHDYGGADSLRYVDDDGTGIDGAKVVFYLAANYDASDYTVAARTVTGSDGRWVSPVYVNAGEYVVVFYKDSDYGPDTERVTVS